mmetsp:Transcript_16864/g.39188  ORF Transcript_16864/g.39188 Transcript_16864/m.39188 type:complete len:228 (+) Transcript_16864:52-735(+)
MQSFQAATHILWGSVELPSSSDGSWSSQEFSGQLSQGVSSSLLGSESLPLRSSVVEKMHSGSIVVRPSSPISRPLSARTPKADGSVAKAGSTDFPNSAIPWMFATTGGSCLEPSLDHPEVHHVASGEGKEGEDNLPAACDRFASVGSVLHDVGGCRPCAWFWRGIGCRDGQACRYCHRCGPGEFQIRAQLRREKKAADNRASRRAGKGSESRVPLRPGLVTDIHPHF